MSVLPSDLLLATAIATVILAFATVYQAWQTGTTVREMREGREQEYRPSIRAYLIPIEVKRALLPALRVMNVGRGPALDVKLKITLKKNGNIVKEKPFEKEVMTSLECEDVVAYPTGLWHIANKISTIDVSGTYKDINGRVKLAISRTIDVKAFVDTLDKMELVRH